MDQSRGHTLTRPHWLHRQSWKSLPLFESSETLEFELDIASQSSAQSFIQNHNLHVTQELQYPRTRWRDSKVTLIGSLDDNK